MMILDAGFWGTFWWALAAAVAGFQWITTGKSPFLWMIWLMVHCEATRRQLWQSAGEFVRHFLENYLDKEMEVRTEILAKGAEKLL